MIKKSIKRNYKCPHCFSYFTKQQSLFRCQSIPEICDYEEDSIYNHQHPGSAIEKQGRLIESQNQDFLKKLNEADSKKCDLCAHETDQRVCPVCHHNLAKDFFSTHYIHIGVIGAMTSQLSHYVAMVQREFMNNTAHNLGLMIHPSSENSLEIRFENIEKSKSPLNKITYNVSCYSLVFHGINDNASNSDFEKYDAFLYFLPIPTLPLKYNAFEDLMQRVHSGRSKKNTINKPFAIAYHSFEKLALLLPEADLLLQEADHTNGYNQEQSFRISGEMMAYTGAWYGANTLHFIKRHLPIHQFFTLSLTYPTDQIASEGAGWHLVDPLIWILYQNKIVKDKNQKDQFRAGIAHILGARKRATKA
jgi:hypothetical protein